jgi:hypothetical protein
MNPRRFFVVFIFSDKEPLLSKMMFFGTMTICGAFERRQFLKTFQALP